MNSILKAGEVFALKNLLPCQEGKIVNIDLVDNEKVKLVVKSFAAGTALSDQTAAGETLLFALDGEAVISYAGKEHTIHAGENFRPAKNGKYSVRSGKAFKLAILTVPD